MGLGLSLRGDLMGDMGGCDGGLVIVYGPNTSFAFFLYQSNTCNRNKK